MKSLRRIKYLLVAMLLLLNIPLTHADELSGHVGLFLGFKSMNSSDWPNLDEHFAMGVLIDIKQDSWPISLVLEVIGTGDKYKHASQEDLGHSAEHYLGVRKIFVDEDSKIQPYINGGVTYITAEQEIETATVTTIDDDSTVGGWLGAGMYYEIRPRFLLGLDMRYSNGKVTLFNNEREAGGILFGVTGSYQF